MRVWQSAELRRKNVFAIEQLGYIFLTHSRLRTGRAPAPAARPEDQAAKAGGGSRGTLRQGGRLGPPKFVWLRVGLFGPFCRGFLGEFRLTCKYLAQITRPRLNRRFKEAVAQILQALSTKIVHATGDVPASRLSIRHCFACRCQCAHRCGWSESNGECNSIAAAKLR